MEGQLQIFDAIRNRVGDYKLAKSVGETLGISDDGAYRRIRGTTELTYSEIRKLSQRFGISIDKIMDIPSIYRQLRYQYHNQNYFAMEDIDIRMSGDYIVAIRAAAKNPYSEFGMATNTLTLHTRIANPLLFRFFILKWMYQYGGPDKALPFSKITFPKELMDHHKQYTELIKTIKYTFIIVQECALQNIVNDIRYFREIRLLSDDDIAALKESLYVAFRRNEQLAINGEYDTGNKVDFYVSGLYLDSSYSYLISEKLYITMIDAYTVGAVTSLDEEAGTLLKQWMKSLKSTSTLITGSERSRMQFFDRQYKCIDQL